jgi:hypothetical protein
MALASAWVVALHGVDGVLVEIEAHIGPGLPGLQMVGLPDAALSEARDRVRAAVLNSGRRWPPRRMTLALSPATLPKVGSGYDLARIGSLVRVWAVQVGEAGVGDGGGENSRVPGRIPASGPLPIVTLRACLSGPEAPESAPGGQPVHRSPSTSSSCD